MKKILTAILAASLLMMLILPAAVQAEQQEEVPAESGVLFELGNGLSSLLDKDGPLVGLFSEGGSLSSVVPEGIDVEKTAEELSKELSNPSSALYQAAAGVAGSVLDEEGNLDMQKAIDLAMGLFGNEETVSSIEEKSDMVEDALTEEARIAAEAYGKEALLKTVGASDEQIVSMLPIESKKAEDGSVELLAYFRLWTYAKDKDALKEQESAECVLYLKLKKGEDGQFAVTEAKEAGKSTFDADLEEMCAAIGTTRETYDLTLKAGEFEKYVRMMGYLDEHPDVKLIQLGDELLGYEDLSAMMEKALNEMLTEILGN